MGMRIVKPSTHEEKQTKTTMDTVELTQKLVASWKSPPFQRDLRVNAKVLALAEELARNGGVLPGILTIGVLDGDAYIVDGQHRLGAWQQCGIEPGYADVRTHWFESMGDMANEFVKLNSQLVRLRPDDIMRGLESSTPALQRIRQRCKFIGYDMIRKSERAPMISMAAFIRCWIASRSDVPGGLGASSASILSLMDADETETGCDFANLCFDAWRRDQEYWRLWGTLNITVCAWLYRRIVLGEKHSAASRITRMSKEEFRKCLMALSAEPMYLDYLVGRNLGDRDRAPTYARVKAIFSKRYLSDANKAIKLPQPAWSHQ